MSTTYQDIDEAIITRITAQWTTTPIHIPGFPYDPQNKNYIQPFVIWQEAGQATLGESGENLVPGVLHINIFITIQGDGGGGKTAHEHADSLRDIFPRNTKLGSSTHKIVFGTPTAQPPIIDENWFQLPVECPFDFFEVPD